MGSVILIEVPEYRVPYALIAGFAGASALVLIGAFTLILKSRRRPVVSGREEMIGSLGETLGDVDPVGWAHVHGETWRVRSREPLKRGARVRVTAIDGLTLEVVPDSSRKGEAP